MSRSSGDLSAHMALPLLSAIGRDSKRVSFALTSRVFPGSVHVLPRGAGQAVVSSAAAFAMLEGELVPVRNRQCNGYG